MSGVVRRVGLSLLGPVLAVVVALVISAVVIALIGQDPLEAFRVAQIEASAKEKLRRSAKLHSHLN